MEERIEGMTDFQMRTMMNMFIDVVRELKDPEAVIKRIIELRDGTADTKAAKEPKE